MPEAWLTAFLNLFIGKVLPITEVNAAHAYVAANRNIGKVVLADPPA